MIRNNSDITTNIQLETELLSDEHSDGLTVVIKHDYYSSDSLNGLSLLEAFISNIADNLNNIEKVILLDSGVKLLSSDSDFSPILNNICKQIPLFMICSSSLTSYAVDVDPESFKEAIFSSEYDIASEIIHSPRVLTIE